jgi:hypothetical protein
MFRNDSSCFSKYFSLENILKQFFYLFLTSVHQNNLIIQKYNLFKTKKLKFSKTPIEKPPKQLFTLSIVNHYLINTNVFHNLCMMIESWRSIIAWSHLFVCPWHVNINYTLTDQFSSLPEEFTDDFNRGR